MKVLMLGWEFPPHISGGLGTACAGLTQALEKREVDVLFVVPKLHGGERAQRTSFINASAIPIRQKRVTISNDRRSQDNQSPTISYESHQVTHKVSGQTTTTIEIPSLLSPYSPTSAEEYHNIQQWNYSFATESQRPHLQQGKQNDFSERRMQTRWVKEPYPFSGKYGSNLLQEVERYAQAVREIARRHSFDVIHAHDWMTYRAGMEARRISGKPLIVHVHATEIDRSGAQVNPTVFQIEKKGMEKAEKVVAVSLWTKNIAIKHYQIPSEKIEVVHNGITPKSTPGKPDDSPFSAEHIVTFLGRVTHQKGPMYFVEAARKVHERFPSAHFVVAGAGDQLPMMIERIAQLRLSSYFHFTGFLGQADIERIWAMSNVYVMPSVSEPFGIAPLEAIQAGVPVIISKQAGVSEVMPHAIKVDFWNTDAFAEAICHVLQFKSLANTLKKNGAEEIKNITWDKAAKKLTTLYYELIGQRETPEKSDHLLSSTSAKKTAQNPVL